MALERAHRRLGIEAELARHRERGERVRHLVAARRARSCDRREALDLEARCPRAPRSSTARGRTSALGREAEGDDRRARARRAPSSSARRVRAREQRRRRPAARAPSDAFSRAIASTRAEVLEVRAARVRDHRGVRARRAPRAARSRRDGSSPISTTAARCSGARRSSVSGTPQWLLRLPSVLERRPRGREHRGHQVLGRGLAGAAGDPDQQARPARAVTAARARWSAARHVVDHDQRAGLASPRPRRSASRAQSAAAAPRANACARNAWPSACAPGERHEQLARARACACRSTRPDAGASTPALGAGRAQLAARRGRRRAARARARGDRGRGDHRRSRRPPRAARARPARSSNGSTSVADRLRGLVTLARDQHHVARRAPRRAPRAIARAAVELDLELRARAPRPTISARDRRGVLAARIVARDPGAVALARPRRAHRRALARGRGRRRSRTPGARGPRRARAPRRAPARARRACARSPPPRRTAARGRRARAGRARRRSVSRPRDAASGAMPERARRGERGGGVPGVVAARAAAARARWRSPARRTQRRPLRPRGPRDDRRDRARRRAAHRAEGARARSAAAPRGVAAPLPARRIVGVDHRGRALRGSDAVAAVEQHELGVEVALERAVVVEMVVRSGW